MKKVLCTLIYFMPVFISISQTECTMNKYIKYRADYLKGKEGITISKLKAVEETSRHVIYDFSFIKKNKTITRGRIRIPKGKGPFPAALLTVGFETGKSVIKMIDDNYKVVIAAVDYPPVKKERLSGYSGIKTAFGFKKMGRQMVPVLMKTLDLLYKLKEVDVNNITVFCVSFGVFTGVPAAIIDKRVRRLVVVQAGGNLKMIIAHNAKRLGMGWQRCLLSPLGTVIMSRFEPNRYIANLSPRKLIVVAAANDHYFPAASIRAFYKEAKNPKEMIYFGNKHIMPWEVEQIRKLTDIVAKKLYGGRRE